MQSVLAKLNDIRSTEQRMSLIYRRCAEMVTGPSRNALQEEFLEHAEDEDEHAATVQRHIMALGGDLDEDVKQIPVWRNLPEMLRGLSELEEEGIQLWTELLHMLDEDDAFRHTVEDVLSKEQEHHDDIRRFLREDYAEKSMKRHGDIGSLVPLNAQQRRGVAEERVQKSSHEEKARVASRAGTPITRRGAFHGAMPGLAPAPAAEPGVVLKAVTNPAEAGGGRGDSVSRKRDPHTGKFAQAASAGPQTTAKEDLAAQQRTSRLAAKRYLQPAGPRKMKAPKVAKAVSQLDQAGIPASPPGQGGAPSPTQAQAQQGQMPFGQQQPQGEQPAGMTQDGMPIYLDPYHPDHQGFSPEQHADAAQLHSQLAEQATGSGRIPTAMEHQMKAAIHGEMGRDAMSPMARLALDQQGVQGLQAQPGELPGPTGGQAAGPGQGGPNSRPGMDPMSAFMAQLPDAVPGGQNAGGPNATGQPPGQQVAGPKPRMIDNRTGGPIGPLTPPQEHAGTQAESEEMPGEPQDGSSMPEIGDGQDDAAAGEDPAAQDGGFSWDPAAMEQDPSDDLDLDLDGGEDPAASGDALDGEDAQAPEQNPHPDFSWFSADEGDGTDGGELDDEGQDMEENANDGEDMQGDDAGGDMPGAPAEAGAATDGAADDEQEQEKTSKSFTAWLGSI